MNTLQNIFNGRPNANMTPSQIMSKLNPQQKNIVMEFLGMSEEERAEKIAKLLNEKGITKTQLENIIKNFKK